MRDNNDLPQESIVLRYPYFILISGMIFVFLLQGCAIQSQQAAPRIVLSTPQERQLAWNTHKQQMQVIGRWHIIGRAGVRTDDDSGSVGVNWQRVHQNYTITFSGPFGRVLAQLSGKFDGKVTLLLPGHSPVNAVSGESLVARATGWDIPVEALRYWILGIPVPDSGKDLYSDSRVMTGLNSQGQLASLNQFGWHITYNHYVIVNHYILPSHIHLEGKGMRVVLVINWQKVGK